MKPSSELLKECRSALQACSVPPAEKLISYMGHLLTWNEITNVTGAKTPYDFALKHIADTFFAWNALGGLKKDVIDVGSGGGLPGIVLAILSPDTSVTLVERRLKKASILSEIVKDLDLDSQIKVVAKPLEETKLFYTPSEVWFRGFLPGEKLIQFFSANFSAEKAAPIVLMKGPLWPEEKLSAINSRGVDKDWIERFSDAAEVPYDLPLGSGKRSLILM